MHRSLIALALTLALPHVALAQPGAGTFEQVTSFGSNPGALEMFRYVPSPAPSGPAPVVVAFHGCTQNVATFRNTGWEQLADELGFYVVYPQQTAANNPVSCFNWAGEYGDETNLRRGEGENQSVISMVEQMGADFTLDPDAVFVMGHSAGAAMAVVMLATWPERFAGGGIIAGIPYRCGTSLSSAFSCQNPGVDRTPEAWAELVRGASGHSGAWPRLSVWHGTGDGIVNPANQRELVEQWAALHGAGAEADSTETVDGYPRSLHAGGAIESWEITGGGHATFIDPESGCGATAAYVSDADICAARHMARFFGLESTDGPPPAMDPPPGTMPPADAGGWTWGGDADGGTGGGWSWGDADAGPGGGAPPANGGGDTAPPAEPCSCCAVSPRGPASGGAALALLVVGAALTLGRRARRRG